MRLFAGTPSSKVRKYAKFESTPVRQVRKYASSPDRKAFRPTLVTTSSESTIEDYQAQAKEEETTTAISATGTSNMTNNTTEWGFSKLPWEIREQIWLELVDSLEPRTLTITRIDSRCRDWEKPELVHHGWSMFVVRLGVHPWTGDAQDSKLIEMLNLQDFVAEAKPRVPAGPTALYVCQQSRRLAMKRYQLAFEGKFLRTKQLQGKGESGLCDICGEGMSSENQQWKERGFGLPRVWVDFERDTIYMRGQLGCRKAFPEQMNIKKLALCCRPTSTGLYQSPSPPTPPFQRRFQGRLQVYLEDFDQVTLRFGLWSLSRRCNPEMMIIYLPRDMPTAAVQALQDHVRRIIRGIQRGPANPVPSVQAQGMMALFEKLKIEYQRL
ncbi:hypothetical protein HYFRA_00002334 [Hymenoscyphus fraxineus]|uniref:2EXR domain-containing protein n=1 Tax=Hymenoscyphus fraxineus TaxID=746836 RepID=A0A9N9LB08_9HELO|nr:hypothetical protein HYFRA_00002334 [Hymenoscyphus fraxineus]